MTQTTDIVICGDGITGVDAAHFLSKAGINDILLVDELLPCHSPVTDPPNATATDGPMLKCSR
jgi:glycine/D-amino acid oxidase-like deaminating enzyme